MSTKTTWIVLGILTAASLVMGLAVYGMLPDQVASHWNGQGEADGYSSALSGILLLPAIMIGTVVLIMFIPAIDPLKENIAAFREDYNGMVVAMAGFMTYLHILTLLFNLGVDFKMNSLLAPGMGGLFFWIGEMIGKARRNFFAGIRTPWTLSSDSVWQKTHERAAMGYKVAGALTLLAIPFPNLAMIFIIGPIMAVSLYAVVYSYVEFEREKAGKA
jgi:immunity protein, SdpI family